MSGSRPSLRLRVALFLLPAWLLAGCMAARPPWSHDDYEWLTLPPPTPAPRSTPRSAPPAENHIDRPTEPRPTRERGAEESHPSEWRKKNPRRYA